MEHHNPKLRTLTSQHRDQWHLENQPAPRSRPEEADEKAEEAEASPPTPQAWDLPLLPLKKHLLC